MPDARMSRQGRRFADEDVRKEYLPRGV